MFSDKAGISIMADLGFATGDSQQEIGIKLNMPLFMNGRHQLPSDEAALGAMLLGG